MPSNEEVRGKPWYYGPISRGDCDNLMAERGQDGDFLVRDSESNVSIIEKKFLNWGFRSLPNTRMILDQVI